MSKVTSLPGMVSLYGLTSAAGWSPARASVAGAAVSHTAAPAAASDADPERLLYPPPHLC